MAAIIYMGETTLFLISFSTEVAKMWSSLQNDLQNDKA